MDWHAFDAQIEHVREAWRPFALIALTTVACAGPATTHPTELPSATGVTSDEPAGSPAALAARPALPDLIDGEADACLPLCAVGLARPGELPIGRYQTQWFFGGYMTIELEEPWTAIEDSTGELKLAPTEDTEYGVSFALDLYPVSAGERVEEVPLTADGIEDWLRGVPSLVVSSAQHADFGGLPAAVVDVSLSASATREHADCPDPCVDILGFEQWDHANGILGDDVYRFYLADVRYSGSEHLFIVTIEGRDQDHLDSFASRVEALLATMQIPAHAP